MIDLTQFPSGGIWIPSKQKQAQWLLVALHGSGGSSSDFVGLETILNISDLNYLYLNGPIRDYTGYRWYSDMSSRQDAYAMIQGALNATAMQKYPSSHTFLMGFSQGAALAIECGARYPHLLAGYIGISGRIENVPGLLSQGYSDIIQKGRWLMTHGRKDLNLSIEIIRQQIAQLKKSGFPIELWEYDKVHEFDNSKELPDIRKWILRCMGQN